MDRNTAWLPKPWLHPLMCLVLISMSGCNSGPALKNVDKAALAAPSDTSGGHIDVMCMGDRINDPSEPFHYSYRYADADRWVEDEAEITPQSIDMTIKNKSGSHTYHGVRSDEASWNSAVLDLSHLNVTAMSGRLDSLNDSSAIKRQGTEPMGGYQTNKYAIDTASANSSDRQKFETLFGKGSFEKGTAWVPADGCAVKLVLDEAFSQADGSVKKAHYEMARIKK